MESKADSFYLDISLPENARMEYVFWIAKDKSGKQIDGWDNNWSMSYYAVFDKERTTNLTDQALYLYATRYNILDSGVKTALVAAIALVLMFLLSGRKLVFRRNSFLAGLWLIALLMSMIIRVQMNRLWLPEPLSIPGLIFSDFLWLLFVAVVVSGLLLIGRRVHMLSKVIFVSSVLLLLFTILFSLLNIEIVRQIGRPLNYQWLYYSDFMQGIDARNAVGKSLTLKMVSNLTLLLAASIVLAYCISVLLIRMRTFLKTALVLAPVLVLFVMSLYQYKSKDYQENYIQNPFLSLAISSITVDNKGHLFSMPVSEERSRYVHDLHNNVITGKYDTSGSITNIVLFVLESTAKQYVNIYDSSFNVTPNLKRWKGSSKAFSNVYAHIPSTPSSMFSLISGVYPLISYKLSTVENAKSNIPSLTRELKKGLDFVFVLLF